tara:strand:- start:211 stop:471 length:261 start_codon:yes stop_codon:yes gene_type:complete
MSYEDLPSDCGYNQIYKHQWKTGDYGIGLHTIQQIRKIVTGRWGWYFQPNDSMNYNSDTWFENQECIITFEDEWDCAQVVLQVEDV